MNYIRTSFSQAVIEMFENADSRLKNDYPDLEENSVAAYLFGGSAVHMHIGSRTSDDVDADIQTKKPLKAYEVITKALTSVEYDDEEGLPRNIIWDGGFSTTLGAVACDYEDRATLVHVCENKLVYLYLISAADIAVSKVSRSSPRDLDDIKGLYKTGLFTLAEFEELAESAIAYCAVTPSKLRFNVLEVIKELKEVRA